MRGAAAHPGPQSGPPGVPGLTQVLPGLLSTSPASRLLLTPTQSARRLCLRPQPWTGPRGPVPQRGPSFRLWVPALYSPLRDPHSQFTALGNVPLRAALPRETPNPGLHSAPTPGTLTPRGQGSGLARLQRRLRAGRCGSARGSQPRACRASIRVSALASSRTAGTGRRGAGGHCSLPRAGTGHPPPGQRAASTDPRPAPRAQGGVRPTGPKAGLPPGHWVAAFLYSEGKKRRLLSPV